MTRAGKEFSNATKAKAFERAGGCCQECTRKVGTGGERAEYDHHKPIWDGGDSSLDNCRVLCAHCHSEITHKEQAPARAEGRRHTLKRAGVKKKPRAILPGSRLSKFKRKVDGTVVRRTP